MESLLIFRKIVESKKKNIFLKNIKLLTLAVLVIIFAIISFIQSYTVTNIPYCYSLFLPVLAIFIFFYSKSKSISNLRFENLDSKDMSIVFDTDHPIALRAIEKVTEKGVYTYADLDHDLLGYEKIEAAFNYAKTGKNKRFKINYPKDNKPVINTKFKNYFLKFLPTLIFLLQLGVLFGVIPTIGELFFNQHLVSITLHHSIKDMTMNNIIPKAITIGLLQILKIAMRKF